MAEVFCGVQPYLGVTFFFLFSLSFLTVKRRKERFESTPTAPGASLGFHVWRLAPTRAAVRTE